MACFLRRRVRLKGKLWGGGLYSHPFDSEPTCRSWSPEKALTGLLSLLWLRRGSHGKARRKPNPLAVPWQSRAKSATCTAKTPVQSQCLGRVKGWVLIAAKKGPRFVGRSNTCFCLRVRVGSICRTQGCPYSLTCWWGLKGISFGGKSRLLSAPLLQV